MLILSVRTDKPEAEIGLQNDREQQSYVKWLADRQLAETLHQKIKQLLDDNNLVYKDLQAILVYRGPGSFTGLRIGISVANAFSYSLGLPIVGSGGEVWIAEGVTKLIRGENEKQVVPEYGSEPHITRPKR
jgi:tRNA threonylcarbamoyladenosine biosynthesis protein TsaB